MDRIKNIILMDYQTTILKLEEKLEHLINDKNTSENNYKEIRETLNEIVVNQTALTKWIELFPTKDNNEAN
jgi:hypothetical protein